VNAGTNPTDKPTYRLLADPWVRRRRLGWLLAAATIALIIAVAVYLAALL